MPSKRAIKPVCNYVIELQSKLFLSCAKITYKVVCSGFDTVARLIHLTYGKEESKSKSIMPSTDSDIPTTDTLKLWEMRQRGMTYEEIGRLVGRSKVTILQRLQRMIDILPDAEEVATFREHRADVLSAVQLKLLAEVVKPDKLQTMSPYQCMGMFGIAFDKERLERGQSSSNLEILTRMLEGSQPIADNSACDASIKSIPVLVDKTEEESGT